MQPSQALSVVPNNGPPEVRYIYVQDDSSSATASNLPGPSRVVGKLFSYLGTKLERSINLAVDKLGYGPLAYRRRLLKVHEGVCCVLEDLPAKRRKRIVGKLMKYIRYVLVSP